MMPTHIAHAARILRPSRRRTGALLCLLLVGCGGTLSAPQTKLPPIAGMPSGDAAPARPTVNHGAWKDYVGVIHVHTKYSDGSKGFVDIARVANRQKLDFVVTTDHNTLEPQRKNEEGWRGTTLLIAGTELTTPSGHLLALGIRNKIPLEGRETQEIIDAVRRQGGLSIIAHPFGKTPWKDWSVGPADGIEVFNVKHDLLHQRWHELALKALIQPKDVLFVSFLRRPEASLEQWDRRLARGSKLFAVAGADAHEFGIGNLTFAAYEPLFKLGRTHILSQDPELTPEGVVEALRSGHAYIAVEMNAPAQGFTFQIRRRNRPVGIMGDTLPMEKNLELYVESPIPAELVLFADGKAVHRSVGLALSYPVSETGIYRVEANRHNKPWVITNPIFIE